MAKTVFSFRPDEDVKEGVNGIVEDSGERRGPVLNEMAKLGLKYHSYHALFKAAYPGQADDILLEQLAPPVQFMTLERVALGEIVGLGGEIYILQSKALQVGQRSKPLCLLRSLDGGADRKVDDETEVQVVDRLDTRLPVCYLKPGDFESKVLSILAGGTRATDTLYREAMAYRGRDTSKMRISRNELSVFVGRLLLHLVPAGLVTVDGDPLTGAWSLSERGEELAKHLRIGG